MKEIDEIKVELNYFLEEALKNIAKEYVHKEEQQKQEVKILKYNNIIKKYYLEKIRQIHMREIKESMI